jgi:hypothetical protein
MEKIQKYRDYHRKMYNEKYKHIPKYKKYQTISNWKNRGVVEDYELLYKIYTLTTNCEECNILFSNKQRNTTKCLDHCHKTGKFRNILCHKCNVKKKDVNIAKHINNKSGYSNIFWCKTHEKWLYYKRINNINIRRYRKTLYEVIAIKFAHMMIYNFKKK